MSTQTIEIKIKALRKRVEKFLFDNNGDIEGVHKIRTSSREILSLLNEQKLHCSDLKKVLKLSNKIRDIDVLITQYLEKIPKDKNINTLVIKDILKEERKKELIVFLDYLKALTSQNIEFLKKTKSKDKKVEKSQLILKKKQLHKYRIFIKNQLYIAKNAEFRDEKIIKLLTEIKDTLGAINDNYNAIKIVRTLPLDSISLKKLKKFTKSENIKSFSKLKELVLHLEGQL